MFNDLDIQDLEDLEALQNAYWEESLEDEHILTDEEVEEMYLSPVKSFNESKDFTDHSLKSFKAVLTPREASNLSSVADWCHSHNEAERLRQEYEDKWGEPLTFDYDSI